MKKLVAITLCLSMLLFAFCGCESIICEECGQFCNEDTAFCDKCGTALPTDPTCTACGTKNAKDAKFCASCGGHLENDLPSSDANDDKNNNNNNNNNNNDSNNDPVVTPGRSTCPTCSKLGYDHCQGHTCTSCEGNWQPTCPGCHGTGKQAFEIWGSDACPVCYGLGWILCEASGCTAGKVFY